LAIPTHCLASRSPLFLRLSHRAVLFFVLFVALGLAGQAPRLEDDLIARVEQRVTRLQSPRRPGTVANVTLAADEYGTSRHCTFLDGCRR